MEVMETYPTISTSKTAIPRPKYNLNGIDLNIEEKYFK